MIRCLLERDAHDAPAVAEFTGTFVKEQTGEIANRHLPLEGHAAAARRVGAHARRYRPGAATAVASLRADRSFRSARCIHPDTRSSPGTADPLNEGLSRSLLNFGSGGPLVSPTNASMLRHVSNHAVGRGQRIQSNDQVRQIAVAADRRKCFSASTSALATGR